MIINWEGKRGISEAIELIDEAVLIMHEECIENKLTDMSDIDDLAGGKRRILSMSGALRKVIEQLHSLRNPPSN